MAKRGIYLYLDVDIIERHKTAGTNISAACNEFLKTYFQDEQVENIDHEKEVQLLRAKLAKANAGLQAQKQKETTDNSKKRKQQLSIALGKLKKLNVEKMSGSLTAKESYRAFFDAVIEEFGLSREELAKKIW